MVWADLFRDCGSEGDLEFARGDYGVFVEEFVEVAETEEKEGVGVAVFTALYCCMRGVVGSDMGLEIDQ